MYDERPRRFGGGSSGGGGFRGGGGFGGPRRSFAPVKDGEEIDVTIEAIAAKGDGIAKKQGFVIFVPGTKVGENVKIRITKVLQKVAFSEIISRGGVASKPATTTEESAEEPSESDSSDEQEPAEDSEDFGDNEEKEDEEETQ